MKKILFFAAAMVAAMSMSAAITEMTCAKAAEETAKLDDRKQGTDSVRVTGYVTNTDCKISKGQQTFWLDDVKGTTKTFQGYWCNLPEEDVKAEKALNVGDKVAISGFLLRYGTTYEMKNGDVEILERVVVSFDTIGASVCEAIDEGNALVDGETTEDYFDVTDVIVSVKSTNPGYHNFTFYYDCDSVSSLQGYNVTVKNLPDSVFPEVGDTVRTIGRLKKYGTTIEILGNCWLIGKGQVKVDTIPATVAEAVAAGKQLKSGFTSTDVYVVTGYVDSIVSDYDTTYHNMSFYMCDDLAAPAYEFEAYRCNVDQVITLNSLVTVMGKIKNFTKDSVTTIEIEKGDVTVIALGIEDVMANAPKQGVRKVMIDGQMYILRDEHLFNALGTMVR